MARVTPDYDFKHKDVSLKSLKIIKKITVDLPITKQASSFTAEIYNESGNYNDYFDHHDDIKIYLGYVSEGTVGVFHGRVEKLGKSWKPSGSMITISGRGMWTLMMEKFEVTSYMSTELGAVLKDLIANNVPGLTTANVGNSGITPDVELIDHAFINDKVTEYCKKAGFDAWVDFDDDLHFTGTPGANSVSLIAGENIEEIELNVDWKKVRNYIRCYGKKVEDVQLIKTEEDATSQGKYGTVMKILKQESLDESSLVQSIVDAELLEDKEAEWGGMAVIPGDERIEPAKTIPVYVPALNVDTSFKVQHVKHVIDPKGKGFQTTVMLVEEEAATARFYKELYEKTGQTIDFSNAGNYKESYVYKFTDDQDSLLTLVNCYTTNSTLLITNPSSSATCTLTDSVVGDANYSKCLPYISQQYENANKFEVSNDGGSTWEAVVHDAEHSFASSVGDKNDFKFKITMSMFDITEISSVGTDKIYGMFGDGTTEAWNFPVPDTGQEIWGLAYNSVAGKLYETENSTGKIYEVDPEDGSSQVLKADLAIELGGCAWDTSNLFVTDRTNNRISKRNSSNFANEDAYESTPGSDPTGLAYDGSIYGVPLFSETCDSGNLSSWTDTTDWSDTNDYFTTTPELAGWKDSTYKAFAFDFSTTAVNVYARMMTQLRSPTAQVEFVFLSTEVPPENNNNRPDGYYLQLSNAAIKFCKSVSLSETVLIDASINPVEGAWYDINVTRSKTGSWELFVNGASKGTASDTTYTTATHVVLRGYHATASIDNIIIFGNGPCWAADKGTDIVYKKCKIPERLEDTTYANSTNLGTIYGFCYNTTTSTFFGTRTNNSLVQWTGGLTGSSTSYGMTGKWDAPCLGVAYDGTQIWAAGGTKIYEHNASNFGLIDNSYAVSGLTNAIWSITWDGTYFYILDTDGNTQD